MCWNVLCGVCLGVCWGEGGMWKECTEVLHLSFDDYNKLVCFNGQTGSGKIYTMLGNPVSRQ